MHEGRWRRSTIDRLTLIDKMQCTRSNNKRFDNNKRFEPEWLQRNRPGTTILKSRNRELLITIRAGTYHTSRFLLIPAPRPPLPHPWPPWPPSRFRSLHPLAPALSPLNQTEVVTTNFDDAFPSAAESPLAYRLQQVAASMSQVPGA